MRKSVLTQNIFPIAKQRLIIDGIGNTEILPITRDTFPATIGVIELEDQTKVPGGRTRSGEFKITLQLARDNDRRAFLAWKKSCQDVSGRGIDANYKRNATLIFLRLHEGDPPSRVRIIGVWPSEVVVSDYDMNKDEGDGDCRMEVTLQYDDVGFEDS